MTGGAQDGRIHPCSDSKTFRFDDDQSLPFFLSYDSRKRENIRSAEGHGTSPYLDPVTSCWIFGSSTNTRRHMVRRCNRLRSDTAQMEFDSVDRIERITGLILSITFLLEFDRVNRVVKWFLFAAGRLDPQCRLFFFYFRTFWAVTLPFMFLEASGWIE